MDAISAISGVSAGRQLTPEQKAQVEKLAARDRDVRAHESAHLAAAGALASGVNYTYQLGPDGKLYAVGGKVQISVPPGLTPEQALAEASQLLAAADAPIDPSSQDMAVATQASQMEEKARAEIAKEHTETSQGTSGLRPGTPFRGLNHIA